MELKQLEYFVITCEKGSFNKAAECLYTTQPNVSKVIKSLEKELGRELFYRNSRGISITPYGNKVLEYAQNILKNVSLIDTLADYNMGEKFSVATYPSSMLSGILTDFYLEWGEQYALEHLEGTAEEVSDSVAQGISELGIVYISKKQIHSFQHILSHKKLEFVPVAECEACVYVGPNHPRYQEESIAFQELSELSFVRGVRDFFSMELHLDHISLGAIRTDELHYVAYTNSTNLSTDLLLKTNVCSLGINFLCEEYEKYSIKALKIDQCEPFLVLGYVKREEEELSIPGQWLVERLREVL